MEARFKYTQDKICRTGNKGTQVKACVCALTALTSQACGFALLARVTQVRSGVRAMLAAHRMVLIINHVKMKWAVQEGSRGERAMKVQHDGK